VPHRNRNRLQ